jgi:transposase
VTATVECVRCRHQGKILKEAKVASDPEDLSAFFASLGFAVKRIGLEAGPLSQWLQSGLK